MEKRIIPHTNLSVSRVCLGTMTFGAQVDETAAAAMLHRCLECGLNFIDTANVYNGGEAERIVGNVLKSRRGQVVLASKVGIKVGAGPADSGLSRAAITKGVEDTLRRLQTDYLDLYYLHQPDYATPIEETLETMDTLVRSGKVRQLGVSNYAAWQVVQLSSRAEKRDWPRPVVVQPMHNLLARGIESELLPMCRELGLFTLVYNPLAGGLLTGKHTPTAAMPGSRLEKSQPYRDRYWHDANFTAVKQLADLAQGAGRSLVSLALNWSLHHARIDGFILGASSLMQLEQNLQAIEDGPLAAEVVAACDQVWKQLRGPSPQYNR